MIGKKLFIYYIIIWLVTSPKLLIQAEEKLNNTQIGFNEMQSLKILPGIKFLLTDDQIIIHVKIQDLLQGICDALFFFYIWKVSRAHFSLLGTEVQSPRGRKNPLQKFGYMMMMAPFVMQVYLSFNVLC